MADGREDFDFLHGTWTVHNRRLARLFEGSDEWIEFAMRADCRPILHGLGNVDSIAADDIPGVGAFEGMTVRLFEPGRDVWHIHWASTRHPGRLDPPLTGSFNDGHGVFFGEDTNDGQPIRVRFDWRVLDPDHATWEQSFSPDGGASWERNWLMDFVRAA